MKSHFIGVYYNFLFFSDSNILLGLGIGRMGAKPLDLNLYGEKGPRKSAIYCLIYSILYLFFR